MPVQSFFFTLAEVARAYGISEATVRRAIQQRFRDGGLASSSGEIWDRMLLHRGQVAILDQSVIERTRRLLRDPTAAIEDHDDDVEARKGAAREDEARSRWAAEQQRIADEEREAFEKNPNKPMGYQRSDALALRHLT